LFDFLTCWYFLHFRLDTHHHHGSPSERNSSILWHFYWES